MQLGEDNHFQINWLTHDQPLTILFNTLQTQNGFKQTIKTQQPSLTQQPSRYDPKDIERDYLSECPPLRRRIRKSKKRKMITNTNAKVRRQRKNKLYIEMLQNRIFELQREIEVLRRTNNTNKLNLKKNNDSQHIINGFFLNKQRHYQKLISFTKQTNIDEQKFMEQYDMLRLRQGAIGKDRIKVINYYYKELSQIMIPDLQKYILKTVSEESDLFDPNFLNNGAIASYVQQWRKDMICDLQLSYEKVFRLSQLKEAILGQKTKMEAYFQEMYESKCKILEVSRRIEMIYDKVNNIFSPRDIAKCLCLIQKYKFEKGFSIKDIFATTFAKLGEEQKELYDPEHLYQSL